MDVHGVGAAGHRTVAAMALVLPTFRIVTVEVLIVFESRGSENKSVTSTDRATFVLPGAGETLATVGDVVSTVHVCTAGV